MQYQHINRPKEKVYNINIVDSRQRLMGGRETSLIDVRPDLKRRLKGIL